MGLKIEYTNREATRVLGVLIAVALVFTFAYLVTHVWGASIPWGPFRTLFDVDGENSLPTWFSSVQLFLIGAVLFLAARSNQQRQYLSSTFLAGGALLFVFLSADEAASIHERITRTARALDMSWLMFGGNHGAWIAVYAVAGLVIVAVAARHFLRLWAHYRRETLVAMCGAAVFGAGAVGIEILSYLFLRGGERGTLFLLSLAAEEFLEMVGASIILYAALLLARDISSPARAAAPRGQGEAARPRGWST